MYMCPWSPILQHWRAMKTPSSLLRNLSSRLSAPLSPSPVAPWPRVRTAFDRWLTSELDDLRAQPSPCTSAIWLSKALDVAIAAQKSTALSIRSSCTKHVSSKDLDHHLDVTIELLDACENARRRVDSIRAYIDSLAIALHCLEGAPEPSRAAVRRARAELESCAATEKRRAEFGRCGSSLRKLGERLAARDRGRLAAESDLHEALRGSQSVALLVVSTVEMASSFRGTRQGSAVPVAACSSKNNDSMCSWGSLVSEIQKGAGEEFDRRRRDGVAALEELAATVAATGRLRGLVMSASENVERKGEVKAAVGELRRRCGELEVRLIGPLERRVGTLYRELIDVRMSLLGMISEA